MSCSSAAADPPRIAGVRRCRRARPRRRGRRRSRGAGRGSAGGGHSANPVGREHRLDPGDVVGARRRPGAQRAARSGRTRCASLIGVSALIGTRSRTSSSTNGSRNSRDRPRSRTRAGTARGTRTAGTGTSCGSHAAGQHPLEQRRAVERRDRQQVEQPEEQVHDREREQDLDRRAAGRAIVERGTGSACSYSAARRDARRRPSARSWWPGRPGSRTACRAGGCACGSGSPAPASPSASTGSPVIAPIAGRMIEPNGSMCGTGFSVSRPASLAVRHRTRARRRRG